MSEASPPNTSENKPNEDLERDKRLLIAQVESTTDPELVWRLRELISEHDEAGAVSERGAAQRRALSWHLEGEVERGISPAAPTPFVAFQVRAARWMFWVSVGSLVVLGLGLMLVVEPYRYEAPEWLKSMLGWAWVACEAVVGGEFLMLAWLNKRDPQQLSTKDWLARLFVVLMPPFRLALHLSSERDLLWLPKLGWTRTNQALFEKLRNDFTPAMIFVSIMIIPLLVVELRYEEDLLYSAPWFPLFLVMQIMQAVIWGAFTFEFLVMASVYEDRVEYVQINWIDALIITFPLLSFFRLARVVQLARGYRLRVLLTRVRQAAVILRLFQRVALLKPEKQLSRARRKLRKNHQDRQEIERLILMLLDRVRQREKLTKSQDDAREVGR